MQATRAATSARSMTSEVAIFVRLWETEDGTMTPEIARHILKLGFSEKDKARMHELAVKNQEANLSPEESEELSSYVKVGDLLAILQSKARFRLKKAEEGNRRHG